MTVTCFSKKICLISQHITSIQRISNCHDSGFSHLRDFLCFRICIIIFYLMFTFSIIILFATTHKNMLDLPFSCFFYMIAWCIHVRLQASGKVKAMTAFRALPVNAKSPTHHSSVPQAYPENTDIT